MVLTAALRATAVTVAAKAALHTVRFVLSRQPRKDASFSSLSTLAALQMKMLSLPRRSTRSPPISEGSAPWQRTSVRIRTRTRTISTRQRSPRRGRVAAGSGAN